MNINVHIERLILDGLPLASSQGPLVQAAVEAELTRLLAERGLRPSSAGAVSRVSAGSIQLTDASAPAPLGHQIARAIHSGLAPAPTSLGQTPSGRRGRE